MLKIRSVYMLLHIGMIIPTFGPVLQICERNAVTKKIFYECELFRNFLEAALVIP